MRRTIFRCFAYFVVLIAVSAAVSRDVRKDWGFDLSGRDIGVSPGDNFYGYANGGWLRRTVIRPGSFHAGPGDDADQAAQLETRTLVEAAAKTAGNTSKVAMMYQSYMDRGTIERRGIAPLGPSIAAIHDAPSKGALARLMGASLGGFRASPFRLTFDPDAMDTRHYALGISVAPLGLPGNSYYSDPKLARSKVAYRHYIIQQLEFAGWRQPKSAADAILGFESALAAEGLKRSASRDVIRAYNSVAVGRLAILAPGFAWAAYFDGAGLPYRGYAIVAAPASLTATATVYARTPLDTLKAWTAFKTVDQAAQYLPDQAVDAYDQFHLVALRGQSKPRTRDEAALDAVNETLTGDVSRLYVAHYLPPETVTATTVMADNLRRAFAVRIARLEWMSPATKAEAQKKLAAMKIEIGSPGRFVDYTALDVRGDDLFGNVERSRAFEWRRQTARRKGLVDRHRWQIPPQFVGGSNEAEINLVAVSAALLRPPVFNPAADPAINYGALGATIGHEITHGFDDQGRKYDASGNLRDWWTPKDAAYFEKETARLASQYSVYEPIPGLHVDGSATVGESLADLGGLLIAIDAYHLSLKGKAAPVIDGYTGDQRVFLGFAQAWRAQESESFIRSTLLTNPHSPPDVRVEETVRNIDSWYRAFDVASTARLYRRIPERIHIW